MKKKVKIIYTPNLNRYFYFSITLSYCFSHRAEFYYKTKFNLAFFT